jgi:hypothetical protein
LPVLGEIGCGHEPLGQRQAFHELAQSEPAAQDQWRAGTLQPEASVVESRGGVASGGELHRSHSALGAFFRRLKSRKGTPKAITATAPKLARLIYAMLKHGEEYLSVSLAAYERGYRERQVRLLSRRARELGYELVGGGAKRPRVALRGSAV